MLPPMTDEQAIIHLQDMANVNYKATDILVHRVRQFNKIKEIILNENIAQSFEHDKILEVINDERLY